MRPARKTGAGAAALAIALAVPTGPARADDPASALLGGPAPLFRLNEVRSGEPVSLEDFRGRFIVLHFGASW